MNHDSPYFKRAKLMVQTLSLISAEKCFGLKGGTAICFFYRDMPRLSIDIDLTYLPIEPRDESLRSISAGLERVAAAIRKRGFHVEPGKTATGRVHKLFVSDRESRIKIEPNEVLRGTIHPVENRTLSAAAEEAFETSATLQTLAISDLYAGKLCAALDRQHPRDLFDVKLLFENEGITSDIRRAFVVYLACNDRPIHELIDPTRRDFREAFDKEFQGMTTVPITVDELVAVRERMIAQLKADLTPDERAFLVSIKEGAPKWELLPLPGIEKLPGLQWKILNIKKMEKRKHAEHLKKLRERLGI
ncbi:MAG: nucleotidyl transferase AbiEii/AbiGii toxin family protein [Deltaproteobacteria bacterium]|nr:nucleotidyl transferase AbiEii/AbiGii toxin family protein [Deltaproteobacteria bacterium]